jgi:protein-tyrosine phosphatase
MREVISNILWIGNAKESRDVKAVLDAGFAAVVDLAMEEPPIALPRDVVYCRFPLVDGEGNTPAVLKAAIDTTVSFVRSKLPTLLTCDGGMSRSPAIAAAALSAIEGMSLEKALERVAASGPHDVSVTFWKEVEETAEAGTQRR